MTPDTDKQLLELARKVWLEHVNSTKPENIIQTMARFAASPEVRELLKGAEE